MGLIISILILIFYIELYYKPRLDYTKEKKLLLWFGNTKRRYITIY